MTVTQAFVGGVGIGLLIGAFVAKVVGGTEFIAALGALLAILGGTGVFVRRDRSTSREPT